MDRDQDEDRWEIEFLDIPLLPYPPGCENLGDLLAYQPPVPPMSFRHNYDHELPIVELVKRNMERMAKALTG